MTGTKARAAPRGRGPCGRHARSGCGCPRTSRQPDLAPDWDRWLRLRAAEGRRLLRAPSPAAPDRPTRPTSHPAPRWPGCSGASGAIALRGAAPGSPAIRGAPAPAARAGGTAATTEWQNLDAEAVVSMPDPWEYPWFAAWDLAFHCVTLAHVDPAFAKQQLAMVLGAGWMRPDRPGAGIRVGLRLGQPARARLGRAARVPPRRRHRSRLAAAGVRAAHRQLDVVGRAERSRRQRHVQRRVPRHGQHRALRPGRGAARRRRARAGGRDRLDGAELREHVRDRARARGDGSGARGHGAHVLRPVRPDRPRHRGQRALARGGRLLLRPARPAPTGPAGRSRCAR